MSTEEAIWLKEVFEKEHQGKILKGATLNAYYEAERILKNKDSINKRPCTCQFKDLARLVNSLMDQYSSQINELYGEQKKSNT